MSLLTTYYFWVNSSSSLVAMRLAIARLQLTAAQVVVVTTQPRNEFLQAWEQLVAPQLVAASQESELEPQLRFVPFALDPTRVFSLAQTDSCAGMQQEVPGYSWQVHQDATQLESQIVHWVVADSILLTPQLLGVWERELASLAAQLKLPTSHQNQLVAQITLLEDGHTSYSPAAQEQLLTVLHYLQRKYQFLTPEYLGLDSQLLAQLGIAPANIGFLERSLGIELNPAPHHQRIARTPLNNTLFVDRGAKDSPIGNVFTSDLKLTTEAAYATASSLGIDVTGTILEDYNPQPQTDYQGILGFIALEVNGSTTIPEQLRTSTRNKVNASMAVHQPRGGLLASSALTSQAAISDDVVIGAANYKVVEDMIDRVQRAQGNSAPVTDYFTWGTSPQQSDLPAQDLPGSETATYNPEDFIPQAWLDYFNRNPHLAAWYANLADTGLAGVRYFWQQRTPEACMGRIQFQAWGLTSQSYNFLHRWQELALSHFTREELLQVAPPSRLAPYFFYDYSQFQSQQIFDSFASFKLELLYLEQVAPIMQQAYLRSFLTDYAALLSSEQRNIYWLLDTSVQAPMRKFLQRFLTLQVAFSRSLYHALEQRKTQFKEYLTSESDQSQSGGRAVATPQFAKVELLDFALELDQAHELLAFLEQLFEPDQVAGKHRVQTAPRDPQTLQDYSAPVQALARQLLTQCVNWIDSASTQVDAYRNDLERLKYASCVFDLRDNLSHLCEQALINLPETHNFHTHNIVWLDQVFLPLELVQFPAQHLVVHAVGNVGALHAKVWQQVSGVNQLLQFDYHLSHHRYLDFAHCGKHVDNAQLMRRLQMYYHTHPTLEQEIIAQHVSEHLLGLRVQRMQAHAQLALAQQMIGTNRTQLQAFEDLLQWQVQDAGSRAAPSKSELEIRLEQSLRSISTGQEKSEESETLVENASSETSATDLATLQQQLQERVAGAQSSLPPLLFDFNPLGSYATAVYDLQLNQLLSNQEMLQNQELQQPDYAGSNHAWQEGIKQRLQAIHAHLQEVSGLGREEQQSDVDTTANTILDIWRGHQGPIFWHSLYTKNKIYPVHGMKDGDPCALDSYKRQIMVQLYLAPHRDWQPYISELPQVMQGEIQVQYPHLDLGIDKEAIQEFLASKNVASVEEYHQQYLPNFKSYHPIYNLPFVWTGFTGAVKYLSNLANPEHNGKVVVFVPESHTHELVIQASNHYGVDYHKLLFWTHQPPIVRGHKATGGCNIQQPAVYAPSVTPFTTHELRELLSVYAFNQELDAIPDVIQQGWELERKQHVWERNFIKSALKKSQESNVELARAEQDLEAGSLSMSPSAAELEQLLLEPRANYAQLYHAWLTYVIETAPLVLAYQRHSNYQVERVLLTSVNREEELALFLQYPEVSIDIVESQRSNALQSLLGLDHAFAIRDWIAMYEPYTQAAQSNLRRQTSPISNLFYNQLEIYKSLNVANLRFNVMFSDKE